MMNIDSTTAVVRRIDDLGRIAIPKEMRQRLGIKPGDAFVIRIYEAAGAVVITKEGSE
jgi:AbrB family looped-hinge helix DNA binding protein